MFTFRQKKLEYFDRMNAMQEIKRSSSWLTSIQTYIAIYILNSIEILCIISPVYCISLSIVGAEFPKYLQSVKQSPQP